MPRKTTQKILCLVVSVLLAGGLHAQTFSEAGHLAMENGDYKMAVEQYEKALVASLKVLKEEDLEVVQHHAELGEAYRAAGRWNLAIQQLDYAWKRARMDAETKQHWLKKEGDMAVEYAEKLGRTCLAASRYNDAVMVFSYMLKDGRTSGRDKTELLQPIALLADTLMLLGKNTDAADFINDAVTIIEKRHANNAAVRVAAFSGFASLYESHRLFSKARPLAERALGEEKSRSQPDALTLAGLQSSLGGILVKLGEVDAAEPLIIAARNTLTEKFASDSDRLIPVWRNLSAVALLRKKPDDALLDAEEALRLSKLRYASSNPEIAKSLVQLAECYAAQKDNVKARAAYKQALAIAEKSLGVDNPQTQEISAALNRLPAK